MEELLLKALAWGVEKFPSAVSLLAVLGLVRMVIKPLMAFLGELVVIIPGDKDDQLLNKFKDSKAFKSLLFVLDWLASIKIKTDKSKVESKPAEK